MDDGKTKPPEAEAKPAVVKPAADAAKPAADAAKPAADAAGPAADPAKPAEESGSKIGRFLMKYHMFVSSFMIGVAGLVATSIWQYRQSETTRQQAESQERVAEAQTANSWKIERAEILGKNLQVLSSTGPGSAEQRYGVLLSLTRGNIIDPELAVSYALELGKDNPEYMQSVLANTSDKDYGRLAHAYTLSCEERYGTTPNLDICADKLSTRSDALSALIADDVQAALTTGQQGPLILLKDERQAQLDIQQLAGLFRNGLIDMYERRQWDEIAKFENLSPGAHLIASLVLAAARTGEFVTDDESAQLDKFHDEQTRWLVEYLTGKTCDAECKARMIEVMLSHYLEAQGDFDAAMRQLLESPRAQSARAVSRLHARLLWCQIDDPDLVPLRDHALVPAATELLSKPAADASTRDAVISLLAVVPDPDPTDAPATLAWNTLMAQIDKAGDRASKLFKDRRAAAAKQRLTPPPLMKKLDFCLAKPADDTLEPTDGLAPP